MEKKKLTNAQLQRRIQNAVVHIDKTKDTQSIYFSDRGLRLTVTDDACVIATGFHRHVFSNMTMGGVSRPYIYTKRIVEIALENDCKTDSGYSYAKLLETLKAKEDQAEYNIATYFSLWLHNIFQPLYSIGETEVESFLVYEDYLHNIARTAVIMAERTEDVTNKQFIEKLITNLQDFTKDIDERVLFPKKTDEEVMQENMQAMQEMENERILKEQANG